MEGKLNAGQTLTRKVTVREPGKKPLIKWRQYFIYIQPNEDDEEYTRMFNLLRPGDIVDVRIELINKGYRERINCNAYLLERHSQLSSREQRNDTQRQSSTNGLAKYLNFEHELQSRFGNSVPSEQEIEELRKKWIRTA
jgi:hypothetical protein